MKRFFTSVRGYIQSVTIVDSLILLSLLVLTFVMMFYTMRENTAHIIADDVVHLGHIFERIDSTAGIVGFDKQKNPVDFLTLTKNELYDAHAGSMKLAYPDKWQGPYLDQNPKIQNRFYQVIKTNRGYYIVPGDGVKLPNGLVIGKDIRIDLSSNIACMVDAQGESATMYDNKSLIAGPFQFTGGIASERLTPLQEEMAQELV